MALGTEKEEFQTELKGYLDHLQEEEKKKLLKQYDGKNDIDGNIDEICKQATILYFGILEFADEHKEYKEKLETKERRQAAREKELKSKPEAILGRLDYNDDSSLKDSEEKFPLIDNHLLGNITKFTGWTDSDKLAFEGSEDGINYDTPLAISLKSGWCPLINHVLILALINGNFDIQLATPATLKKASASTKNITSVFADEVLALSAHGYSIERLQSLGQECLLSPEQTQQFSIGEYFERLSKVKTEALGLLTEGERKAENKEAIAAHKFFQSKLPKESTVLSEKQESGITEELKRAATEILQTIQKSTVPGTPSSSNTTGQTREI